MSDASRSPQGATGGAAAPPHPHKNKAIALAIAAAVGGFLFGFDSSVINGAVEGFTEDFQILEMNAGSFIKAFVVAIALLGCALGAWVGGKLADRWGRTKVMFLGAVLFFVSSILSAIAFGVWDLALWRFMAGIGIGVASVIAPAYIAEIAPAAVRGRLGSLQQLAIVLGIFAALLSDQLLALATGVEDNPSSAELWLGLEAWRWMFLVAVIPATVYGILALRIPESPRYLVAMRREDEALKVLRDVLPPEEDAQDRIDQIKKTIAEDKEHAQHASLRGPGGKLLPVVWVGIMLSVFQQFVGINVIFYYSNTLWQAVGFDASDSFTYSTITSVTNVVVTFIAIALIDKVGRRPLLLVGSVGMAVTLGIMALAFTQSTEVPDPSNAGEMMTQLPDSWGVAALVAANLFVVFFGATWGPLVWVLLGEMFPNRIRAAALGLAAAAQWIANFVITMTFPPLLDTFGATIPYLLYAIFAAMSFFFVLWKVPETKGIQLEDMEGVKVERTRRGTSAPA